MSLGFVSVFPAVLLLCTGGPVGAGACAGGSRGDALGPLAPAAPLPALPARGAPPAGVRGWMLSGAGPLALR